MKTPEALDIASSLIGLNNRTEAEDAAVVLYGDVRDLRSLVSQLLATTELNDKREGNGLDGSLHDRQIEHFAREALVGTLYERKDPAFGLWKPPRHKPTCEFVGPLKCDCGASGKTS